LTLTRHNGASAEEKLVLLLARRTLTPDVEAEARVLLRQELCWPLILQHARSHGVTPLVARNLDKPGIPSYPVEVRAELEAARQANAMHNALLRAALVRVLCLLGEAGVPVIPLKGVALAQSLYGDITLRVTSDIDVLVPREAGARVLRLLLAEGYELCEGNRFDICDTDFLVRSDIECMFVTRVGSAVMPLDLHWDIVWRWHRDHTAIDDLWAEARKQTLWGVESYALSREWEILYLAVHAAHHRWAALKWLVDVHEACVTGPVDWDRLRQKASRFGWERVLAFTLSASHALFGTPVPADLVRRELPRGVRLFPQAPVPNRHWDEALFAVRLLDGWLERLRYLSRLIFVPTIRERRSLPLPSSLAFLYYPLRPVRLAGRWTTRLRRASRA
jgi:hypothetical protein